MSSPSETSCLGEQEKIVVGILTHLGSPSAGVSSLCKQPAGSGRAGMHRMVLAGTGAHPLQRGVGQVHEGAGNKVGRVLWKSRECGWELFMEQIKGADSLPMVCVNISGSQKLWMAKCSRNGSKGAGPKEKSWRMDRNPLAFLHRGDSSEIG